MGMHHASWEPINSGKFGNIRNGVMSRSHQDVIKLLIWINFVLDTIFDPYGELFGGLIVLDITNNLVEVDEFLKVSFRSPST